MFGVQATAVHLNWIPFAVQLLGQMQALTRYEVLLLSNWLGRPVAGIRPAWRVGPLCAARASKPRVAPAHPGLWGKHRRTNEGFEGVGF